MLVAGLVASLTMALVSALAPCNGDQIRAPWAVVELVLLVLATLLLGLALSVYAGGGHVGAIVGVLVWGFGGFALVVLWLSLSC